MDARKISGSRAAQVSSQASLELDALGKSQKVKKGDAIDPNMAPKPVVGDVNVNVSAKARELGEAHRKAFDIAKSTPDVREDRIAAIKQQVQDGTYKVDSGNIADGILREAVREKLAQEDQVNPAGL